MSKELTLSEVRTYLPIRPAKGHKGTFGKVCVVGGSVGFTGAPVFSADAAVRCGSGLVFAGVPRAIYEIVAVKCAETMPFPLACDEEGRLTEQAWEQMQNRLRTCDAVLLGPGLGRSRALEILTGRLLQTASCPVVLDADALYAIRNQKEWLKERAGKGLVTILTPHEGEFAYLGGWQHLDSPGNNPAQSGQRRSEAERQEAAARFAKTYGCILVLKGPGTIVAEPDGRFRINTTGNCGMAKGGSGDVLAGMILSFLGQKAGAAEAAALAVWMHGRAGDLCAERYTPYAMRPTDLLEMLPEVFLELNKCGK